MGVVLVADAVDLLPSYLFCEVLIAGIQRGVSGQTTRVQIRRRQVDIDEQVLQFLFSEQREMGRLSGSHSDRHRPTPDCGLRWLAALVILPLSTIRSSTTLRRAKTVSCTPGSG